jgi:hypothetical protein
MTQREKLLQRLRNNPDNVSFDTLASLLQAYGFVLRTGGGGSHFVFIHSGCSPLVVPFARPVGRVYVKRALDLIEQSSQAAGGSPV